MFALIGGDVRHGGGAGGRRAARSPCSRPTPARRGAARGLRALPRGDRGDLRPRGAAGRVRWARAARASRSCCGRRSGRTRAPPAHALSYLPLRHLYRDADAIVTYGPHVSAYVRAKGARGPVFEAPQSVDDAFWTGCRRAERRAGFQALFAGRLAREKGVCVLLQAWPLAGLSAPPTALVLVGDGPIRARAVAAGAAHLEGPLEPEQLRNFYAGSDVVVVPSIPTRDFLEPWGLVVNEAFDQGVPVIATDAVGAAAGGLVQHERTGLVVPAGRRAARSPPRCAACTTTRSCARGSAPTRARRCARTPTPPGRRA